MTGDPENDIPDSAFEPEPEQRSMQDLLSILNAASTGSVRVEHRAMKLGEISDAVERLRGVTKVTGEQEVEAIALRYTTNARINWKKLQVATGGCDEIQAKRVLLRLAQQGKLREADWTVVTGPIYIGGHELERHREIEAR